MLASKKSRQKYDCDRSGFTYKKDDLIRQDGLLVSESEHDSPDPIPPRDYAFSPRSDSNNIEADDPTTFLVSTSGISSLSQSFEYLQDGDHQEFFMFVEGDGGAVVISSNPQIVSADHGTRLVLKGTSDVNTVLLSNGNGVRLINGYPMVLRDRSILNLVYDSDLDLWIETSRESSGIF